MQMRNHQGLGKPIKGVILGPEETSHGYDSITGHTGGSSHQGHSQLSRDRSNEYRGRSSLSSMRERRRHPSAALDATSRALKRVA